MRTVPLQTSQTDSRTADALPPDYWCAVSGGPQLRAKVWHETRPGLPILFLNGVGTSLEIAAPLAACFPGRRFIALEMPGAGLTEPSELPLGPPLLARMAVEAARQLGAPRFDLIGLSLGGALAQQVTLQYRDRVARLVLAGTCSGFSMLPPDWSEDSLWPVMNPFMAFMSDLMSDMHGPHLHGLVPPCPAAMAGQFASFAGWSSLAFLPLIQAPTLVLAGARDRLVPPANALQLATFIPQAEHRILPDTGHLFPFTDPERTASHIARFFETADVATPVSV